MLVYALDAGEPDKRKRALQILSGSHGGDFVVSTQVLLELYAVATRKLGLPEEGAANAVEGLARLSLVGADAALVQAGIATSRKAGISIWDAMIVEAAAAGGCERILTEDLADGSVIRSVRIENPFR